MLLFKLWFLSHIVNHSSPDAGGLFEGDLFGDVTAGSAGGGAAAGLAGTSAQPQSLQVLNHAN